LQEYQFDKIFPGCRIMDIHEYLAEKGVKLEGVKGTQYLYHDPCHTPMKLKSPMSTVKTLVGEGARLSERCCGEAGTFATSRPDIATQVKFRKAEELDKGRDAQLAVGASEVKVLTSCPACLQGLSRYSDDNGMDADYIVVELAKKLLGEDWMAKFLERANNGGIEKVLL
jgi:Fe-S oxidoreductase